MNLVNCIYMHPSEIALQLKLIWICPVSLQKSDLMKNWGNEAFAKEQFDIAAASYTKAIELW